MNGLALFAGVGGLDLGINLVIPSSRTVCFVEREAYASAVLRAKMEEGRIHKAPIWSDVTTFDGKPFVGKVDYISAGFPCQPWSVAGKQKGTDDERWLWDDIRRIICEIRPRFLFLENVPGIVNGGLDPILRDLAQIGFNAEWGMLKASEVGANHHRCRFFLFAYCSERGCNLSYSNGFTNCYGRNDPALQKFILKQNINIRRSNYNEFQLQPIKPKGKFENISNSNGSRSTESWEICERPNGSKFECDGEKGTIIQHPNHKGRSELDSSPLSCELGFIDGRYDSVGRSPTWWSVEPSVGRVVDGMAHRVDRLRACGNGVVPLQAGFAYSILIERAIKRRDLIDS